jgi:2,5-diketo-D-gluconate reductase B
MTSIYFQRSFQRSFGTYPLKGEVLARAMRDAADVGYRAFDTAQMYGNEAEVGAALADFGLPRDELCITTKVDNGNYGRDRFLPSVEASLKALRLDVVDVLLLHWPPADGQIAEPLALLAETRRKGLARHIGISNFTAAMMREAGSHVDGPLVTNQVEFHPLLDQSVLLAAAIETGIPLSSYCSVARGAVFEHALFGEIGAGLGRTAGQVVLRWILQKGVSINTMSTRRENIAANFDVMDFTLSNIDMARIDGLTHLNRRVVTSDLVPWAPTWD